MKEWIKRYGKRHRVDIGIIALALTLVVGFQVAEPLRDIPAGVTIGSDIREISARQAFAGTIDAQGEIDAIYAKNCDEKTYPASTTKIMTAMLVIETLERLHSPIEQEVTVPDCAVGAEGSSIYLKKGEKISIEDLLYGMMLRSGNDAALALAAIIGGDVDTFVGMMNTRAAELGCTNTHFMNPNGLFDENHYTTARDMALITAAAMQNETFRKIAATEEYTAHRGESDYLYFYNKNKTVHQYDGGSGVKIGYTKKSGRTLVASAEREGETVICVVMNAPDWFNDAYMLMDACFARTR